MSQQSDASSSQPEDPKTSSMHIDVKHMSAGGNIVFAGHDGTINVNTGGDVDQSNLTEVTIGGVSTSRQEYEQLLGTLQNLDDAIKKIALDAETQEEARFHQETLEKQLTSERPPNGRILVQAAKRLYKMSPAIAGAVISIFSEPLVGQIMMTLGGVAKHFYEALLAQQGE